MQHIALCRLCRKEKDLQLSHIIPRSFIKRRKQNGKIVYYTVGEGAKTGNFDPKEHLLCYQCEQYISREFESYGIDLLKNKNNVVKVNGGVLFKTFNYKKFYLFLISILWRASVSKINEFKQVDLHDIVNDLLRFCLLNNTLEIGASIRLSHFVKIAMLRVVDERGELGDDILKGALFNINFQAYDDQMYYYLMVDGFLVVYNFARHKDMHDLMSDKIYAQLSDHSKIVVPTCDFRSLSQIYNAFYCIANDFKENITKN